jgi:phosphoglycerate dehydrogenase-like enzyme
MDIQETALVNVLLTHDFSDQELERLAGISPRLHFVSHPAQPLPDIGADLWEQVEVLYTPYYLPDPEDVPNLRWVQFHSAGVNQFLDAPLMQVHDITFTTASGIHATTIAEYVFAMLLAFGHKLLDMLVMKARGEWPKNAPVTAQDADAMRQGQFTPLELRGRTLGIVGYGSIGREIARLGETFGMTVLATKRDVKHPAEEGYLIEKTLGDPQAQIVDRLYPPQALHSMVRECDFVVITVPLTGETRHIFSAAALAAMKPTAVLVNVSRGAVVDEKALVEALKYGGIAGAALDVFEQEPLPPDSPLWDLPNVILSPHIAGVSHQYDARAARLFAQNLTRYLDGKPLLNVVNRDLGY